MSNDVVEQERAADSLPDDWREVAVADVVAMLPGFAFKSEHFVTDTDAGLPLIRIRDLGQTNTATRYVGDYDEVFAVRDADILVGMDGAFEAVRWQGGKALLNQRVLKLSPARPDAIDEGYLFYRVQPALSELEQTISGTTVKHLSTKDLKRLVWKLPPLDEQRRIAEVLRSVDDAIAANAALLDGVKATKQGTMEAVLSGGFDEVRLETLLADTRYPMRSGPFGSALLKSELQPDGIPFLGIDNVHVERFVPVYRRFISDEKYRELSRYTVYPSDVMVTIMGTVGRCCVVPPDVGTAISSKHVWTLTIDQDRYSPALLAWQINHSPAVLAQLQGSAQGGIMSAISSGTLRDLLVPLPSVAEVRKIESLLLSFNAQIAALETEHDAANALKAALMSDLLSGHVRVSA